MHVNCWANTPEIGNTVFISKRSLRSRLQFPFIRVVIICGSRVSARLTILSHALYKLLTWKSLRRVATSCRNICRQTATDPSPPDTCSLLSEPTSLPASCLCRTAGSPEKAGRQKHAPFFSLAEPLPHAFRSVFCFSKQATLTGLFFLLPKAGGTDTSRYLPVNNAAGKADPASAIASQCVLDEDKNKSSEFEFLLMSLLFKSSRPIGIPEGPSEEAELERHVKLAKM